jgi:hypothetical protein
LKIRAWHSWLLFSLRPKAMATAVGSLIIRRTLRPVITLASSETDEDFENRIVNFFADRFHKKFV